MITRNRKHGSGNNRFFKLNMKERNSTIIKLLSSHLLPVILLLIFSFLINHDFLLLLLITQTVLIVLYLAGYWEFFGRTFKLLIFILAEILIGLTIVIKLNSDFKTQFSYILITSFSIIELYLLYNLVKILVVIYLKEKDAFEIFFPFKGGIYLKTG